MNKKKNNRKIISVLIVLACFVLFAGVLFTGIRNYKTEKKENPVQGVSSESSLKGYLGKGYAYAGAQDNISAGEESFGEQAQLLEDTKDEPVSLYLWGVGDHGGGPSRVDLTDVTKLIKERAEELEIIHSNPEAYFKERKAAKTAYPVVEKSLNPVARFG